MENFECKCDLSRSDMTAEDIFNFLPQSWSTKILEVRTLEVGLRTHEIKFIIAAFTIDEIKSWVQAFEEKSKCTYSVRSTDKSLGRYVHFKQRLHCQHNTRCSITNTFELSGPKRTRNTNCPSSIKITLRAIKKRYRGKNKNAAPDPQMPCEILLTTAHNHSIGSADALRFRKVSEDAHNNLLQLFERGHTPATALESMKIDIQLSCNNYEELLADRKLFPDYNYCYHVYKTKFQKCEPMDFNTDTKPNLADPDILDTPDPPDSPAPSDSPDTPDIDYQNIVLPTSTKNIEEAMLEGKQLIDTISEMYLEFLKRSPEKVASGLKLLKAKTRNLKTVPAFVSSCATFGSEYHRKIKRGGVLVQRSVISRRKTILSVEHNYAGSRPRKRKNTVKQINTTTNDENAECFFS